MNLEKIKTARKTKKTTPPHSYISHQYKLNKHSANNLCIYLYSATSIATNVLQCFQYENIYRQNFINTTGVFDLQSESLFHS